MNNPLQFTRREALKRSGMGLGMLGLGDLMASEGLLAETTASKNAMAPRTPHFAPRAKHVIHIFLNGGAPHIDMYDPKPLLNKLDNKPVKDLKRINSGRAFGSPFKFRKHGQSGLEVSELCENVGKVIDDVCLVRSAHTSSGEHEGGLIMMNTGTLMSQTTPSVGSWTTYGLGAENQNLPAFVVLCPGNGGMPIKGNENWRSSFLPPIYQGTFIDTFNADSVDSMVHHVSNKYVGPRQQRRQIELLQRLNRRHLQRRRGDGALEARIQSYEMAFRMQAAATDAFDINGEPAHIHEMYGSSPQAKQMLIARRLVERGVRFVQVWHGPSQPWDLHTDLTKRVRALADQIDQPTGDLIADLKQRGLLDETLVYWCGEFGRMPTVEYLGKSKTKGRSHNAKGFTVCMAGGGVKGGHVHGATDEYGYKAVENLVHVHDLHATILHLLGLDHKRLTFRHAGRDFRLTDVAGNVVHDILA